MPASRALRSGLGPPKTNSFGRHRRRGPHGGSAARRVDGGGAASARAFAALSDGRTGRHGIYSAAIANRDRRQRDKPGSPCPVRIMSTDLLRTTRPYSLSKVSCARRSRSETSFSEGELFWQSSIAGPAMASSPRFHCWASKSLKIAMPRGPTPGTLRRWPWALQEHAGSRKFGRKNLTAFRAPAPDYRRSFRISRRGNRS